MRIVALPLTFLFTTLVVAQAPGGRRQAAAPAAPLAQSATVRLSNYQRAAGLQARFAGKTLDAIDAPVWLASGKLAFSHFFYFFFVSPRRTWHFSFFDRPGHNFK